MTVIVEFREFELSVVRKKYYGALRPCTFQLKKGKNAENFKNYIWIKKEIYKKKKINNVEFFSSGNFNLFLHYFFGGEGGIGILDHPFFSAIIKKKLFLNLY